MNYEEIKRENIEKIRTYNPAMGDGSVDFYPRYIQVEQTNRCNAECIMCNHFYLENRGCMDLSEDVTERLEQLLPYCSTVMLNGDGEPFLSRSVLKNIERYVKYGIEIGTNTNLTVVPEKVWRYLAFHFQFLNISCDGATKDTYELIRRNLSYDVFTSNLKRLQKEAPDLKKNFDCVVMKQNIQELPDIVRLAAEHGISSVRFQRLGVNPLIGNDADRAEYYYETVNEKLEEAFELGRLYGVHVTYPVYQKLNTTDQSQIPGITELRTEVATRKQYCRRYAHLSLENDYFSERVEQKDLQQSHWNSGKSCQWAIERCYIDLKGNITTCCFNMKKYMGNILEQSFDEIWNGEAYRTFRKMMGEKKLPGFCRSCNWIIESKL